MGAGSQEQLASNDSQAVAWVTIAICAVLGLSGLALGIGRGGFLGWILAGFLLLGCRIWLRPSRNDSKVVAKAAAGFIAAVVLLFVGMVASWETAEVMVLHQLDENGDSFSTRLWVIDLRGYPSFAGRVPSEHRRMALLQKYPKVELERNGRIECRVATLIETDKEIGEEALRLYDEKYGFRIQIASQLINILLGGSSEENPVLVRLEPCNTIG